MVHSLPLRFALPAGFLALSAVLMAVTYGLRSREVTARNEALMQERAAGLGRFAVPELAAGFARDGASAGQPFFQRVRAIPHLKTALVCDAAGLILNASREALRGRRLAELTPAAPALLGAERAEHFEFSADRTTLWSAFPLSLEATGAAPRPGWLCTESDVAAQMAPAIAAQHRGTALVGGLILIVCAGLWYFFDRTVTRRATALVAATRAIAAGRWDTRAAVMGAEEFAQLGTAINQMADELKAREAAARRIERRATDAIQASGMGTWAWNVATNECVDSSGWARILGFGPDEISQQISAWEARVHPEDLPAVLAALATHRKSRTPRYSFEYRMRHKAGHWVWVLDVGEVTERDASGGPVRMAGTCREVTARKEAELTLRESEARFHAMADTAPVMIWVSGPDKLCTYFNQPWLDFTGRTPEQELGNGWADGVHAEDLARCLKIYVESFDARRPFKMEYRLRRRDGKYGWILDHGVPRFQPGGSFAGYIGSCIDITEFKAAERLLAEQRDLFEHIAAGQPLAASLDEICRLVATRTGGWRCSILVLDRDGRRLPHGAAPGLPAEYCQAIDGVEIGPSAGSCGTAAFRREPVVVADIATDPLWENNRGLAAAHGLRACWSTPILDDAGEVLGTFALYAREPRRPDPAHKAIVRLATHGASIALQRARAATDLRTSEDRFEKSFRASPVAIFISHLKDGRIVDVNQAFLDLFGRQSRDEVIGRTSLELNMWDDPADRQRVVAALAQKGALPHFECTLRRPTGERRDALASVEVIDLEGERCMLALVYDITDRKEAEAALRQSEAERNKQLSLLEASLDSLHEGVVVCDMTGDVFYWNRAALEIHGYASIAECRRRLPEYASRYAFILPDGSILPFEQWPLVRILRGEPVRDWEGRLHDKIADWTRLFVFSGALAHDPAGQPILGILTMSEITARRELEEQLRQSQKMDAIGQLAGGVAHDFNNILTAVILRVELADMEANLPADTREALAEIGRLGQRAAGLTRQLLAFSRRSVMQREPLNLSEVVAADTAMLRRLVGENIRLAVILHPQPLPVFADEGMIGQVLLNLAVNARDAMPQGGRLRIETSERVVAADARLPSPDAAPGRYACVRIEDSGSGIAPEHLPRIFEPFFTTKPVGQGTGLGLATVYGIVRQHQGWITVASAPGDGATFLVGLPLVAAPEATTKAGATEAPHGGTETILLVEDEEAVRVVTSMLLSRHGYRVLEAGHGPAALEIWRREQSTIALLLTDLVMPEGMTGQELAARLQAEAPALKVVFTSGYSAEIAGRDLSLQSRQNFLQKPFTPDELLVKIREALDA